MQINIEEIKNLLSHKKIQKNNKTINIEDL